MADAPDLGSGPVRGGGSSPLSRTTKCTPMRNPIALLRTVALTEGVSFLVLLFVAMPLKYAWGQPGAVRIVGMAHGVLFVIFCAVLFYTMVAVKWPAGRGALIFAASLIPFGPWLIDRRMKGFEANYLSSSALKTAVSAENRGEKALDKRDAQV